MESFDSNKKVNLERFIRLVNENRCAAEMTVNFNNALNLEGAKQLAAALKSKNCPRKLTLNLQGCKLPPGGAECIATALQSEHCPSDLTLDFSKSNLNIDDGKQILSALLAKNHLKIQHQHELQQV